MPDNLALAKEDALHLAEQLLRSVGVPPQPQVVVDLSMELAQPHPDFDAIAELVENDPSLAARALKLVNSALWGLPKRVESIKHAVAVLGIDTLNSVIITAALEESLGCRDDALNQTFWSHSLTVARTARMIAKRVLIMPEFANQAYLAGLFHDCAIPLFRRKYPDYDEIARACLRPGETGVEEENRRYDTDHGVVGYLVARFWRLPEPVGEAIWFHHDPDLTMHADPVTRTIKAVLLLADYIAAGDGTLNEEQEDEAIWCAEHEPVLRELKLTLEDVKDLKDDALIAVGAM